MTLRSEIWYARELRPALPPAVFAPARSRVLWLPLHAAVIATAAWALATGRLPWLAWPLASLVIGCSMGALGFLGHETLHGCVVRGRRAIRVVAWLAFLPFTLSPQLWLAWHNRVHHYHCGVPGVDPDMYPTLEQYRTQRGTRIMVDYFSLGHRRVTALVSIVFGFTGQSLQVLRAARTSGMLTARQHRLAIAETLLGVAWWGAPAAWPSVPCRSCSCTCCRSWSATRSSWPSS